MPAVALRETYRRAELRLRTLLFGDENNPGGRLRGEEPRREAAAAIRRMRTAFDDVVEEAAKPDLPDELREAAAAAARVEEGQEERPSRR